MKDQDTEVRKVDFAVSVDIRRRVIRPPREQKYGEVNQIYLSVVIHVGTRDEIRRSILPKPERERPAKTA